MLILTRNMGEAIIINDDITVIVLGCKGNQIKMGFEAPPHVTILRTELLDQDDNS